MATTPINVLQMALANLGQTDVVTSIDAPTSKFEVLGSIFYPRVRDRILARHNWSWSTRRATLVAAPTEVRSGWGAAYTLPADLARVIDLDLGYRGGAQPPGIDPVNPTLPGARIGLEMNNAGTGRVLLCDIDGAVLIYAALITDLNAWSPDAIEALAWALSARLAMPVTTKPDLAQFAEGMARKTLDEAIADDVNELRTDPMTTSEMITVRAW